MTGLMPCLILLAELVHCVSPTSIIRAPWGALTGVRIEGKGGKIMDGYLGVPFAQPPTGPLRWQKPVAHPGLEDGQVFAADTLKPACQQEEPSLLMYDKMSEDCLTLNVFVPVDDSSDGSLRPTMVFIHGGAFVVGDAPTFRPTPLVAGGGVIVVTIQYRLGALGFLATGDDTLLGNYGLWDQRLALKWVKDNIRAFGGDPGTITIFGESAGGWSVGLHVLSPKSKGLFRRAILQSGAPTIFGKNEYAGDAETTFNELAVSLNCQSDTKTKTLECLRNLPAQQIMNSPVATLMANMDKHFLSVPFAAQVDGDFLPRDPLDLLQDADYMQDNGINDLDVLTGFANNEGGVVATNTLLMGQPLESIQTPSFFRSMLKNCLGLYTKNRPAPVAEKVLEAYYRGSDAGTENPVAISSISKIHGDALFNAPSVKWTRALAAQPHRGRRYMYVLDYDFAFNRDTVPGSHHADDLPLEFELLRAELFVKLNKISDAEDVKELSSIFVQAVTSFARTGDPGRSIGNLLKGEWPEFTDEREAYVALSLSPEIRQDVFKDRMALWLNTLPVIISNMSHQKFNDETTTDNLAEKEEL